jgi:AraC-like DNA-binding protein
MSHSRCHENDVDVTPMVGNEMATYLRIPRPPLSEFVELIWLSENYLQPHPQERLLPTGTMTLVIFLDEASRLASGISGAHSEFTLLDTSKPFSMIGVAFKPGGGFPFIGLPAGELHNLDVPLEAVWGRSAAALRDRLLDANTPQAKFGVVEGALAERAARRPDGHPAVRYALKQFGAAAPFRSVADVTAQIGLSSRRFIEIFRNEVGLTPKLFCRIRRFQRVLDAVDDGSEVDWTNVALSCGYFDQSHFIHDFRAFSGVNPTTYLRYRTSRNHVAVHD